jgi:hypothetical protein
MTVGMATTLRNARLDAITTAAGSAAKLQIYDGTRPATGGTATNKLAEFTMGSPFAAASAAGVLTITLPANTTGLLAGTATWARLVTSGAVFVQDMSVGTSGTDIVLNTATISIGVAVALTAASLTDGNP